MVDVLPQRCVEVASVLSVQVDFIVGTVQADRTVPAAWLPSISSM
jgi:hypothetical protein